MQSSETPGYQKVAVDMTPDVDITTNINTPKMNLDLDSIQKSMDTNQWLLLLGTSIIGGVAQACGLKLGDKIIQMVGKGINKLKLRTRAYNFEGLNFNKDLQEYNRINLGYEKIQNEIDRQKEVLKQLDQKAGQNINQQQKEYISQLEYNLHQSQYDTSKNFINTWSYSQEDLTKMKDQMDKLQNEIDNIKGYEDDEFYIYPDDMRNKAQKWQDKYNIQPLDILNQKWSDLHNYLNQRNDIIQADKDSILRLNQDAEIFRQQEQDTRKQRYNKDRLPNLQYQLDTIKASFDKGVKPQLTSWLDHFNVDNKDQLIKKIYTSFQDEGVDPLAQDIYNYNWEINDQSFHTHPTSKQTKYYKPDNYKLHDYIKMINGDIEKSYEQINNLDRLYNVYWKDHLGEALQDTKGKKQLKMPTTAEEKMIRGLQKRINTISPALKKLAEFIRVNDITDSEAVIASDILDSLEGGKYYKGKPINTDTMMKLYETNDNILNGLVDELKQYEPQMNFMNRQKYKLPELKEAIDQLFFNGEKKTQDEKIKHMKNSHGKTIYVEVPQFAPKIYIPQTVQYDTAAQTMNKLKDLGYDRYRSYKEAEFDKVPSNKSLANDERVNKALNNLYNNTLESLRNSKTIDYQNIIDQYNNTRQDILKNSKQYLNDIMKFSDEAPKDVKINQLILNTMDGNYQQYSEFTQDIMKQAEQYYKKKKNYQTFKNKYPNIQNQNQFLSQVSQELNNLANSSVDDIAIKNFNDFINSFRVNSKEPINPNTLDMRSRGQSWKDYLKEYDIKYDLPVQEVGNDKQLHYNRDRHTFQVEDGGNNLDDILQNYIQDTYKNPRDFLRQDSKTKQNIMKQIIQDDIILKSDNPIFKDFQDLVFVNDTRPVFQDGIYDTSKLQKQTQNLIKMWDIDQNMNRFINHKFDEQKGVVGKLADWGVEKLANYIQRKFNPQQFIGTSIDSVIESNPISRVIAEMTLGPTREERMRKYDYVFDKIKDWLKESI